MDRTTNSAGEINRVFFGGAWQAEEDHSQMFSLRSGRQNTDHYTIGFTGTGIDIYSRAFNGSGYAMVSIDDGPEVQVDFYRPVANGPETVTLVYSIDGLPRGNHTIKVRVVATSSVSNHPNTDNGTIGFESAIVRDGTPIMYDSEVAKKPLVKLVDEIKAEDLSKYSADSLRVLNSLLAQAGTFLRDDKASAADVNQVLAALRAAYNNLEIKPESYKDILADLIADAKKLNTGGCTAASVWALEYEIGYAEEMLANIFATASDLTIMLNRLQSAMDSLRLAAAQTATVNHRTNRTTAAGTLNAVYYYSANAQATGGSWVNQGGGAASSGMYTYAQAASPARQAGDYYSITFVGSMIEIWTIMKSNHGWAEIFINDVSQGEVDFWMNLPEGSETTDINMAYRSPDLGYGTHTIKVVFLNKVSQHASNSLVSFSYAYVYSSGGNDEADVKTLLSDKIDEAGNVDRAAYSTEQLAILDQKITAAEQALISGSMSLEELIAALTELQMAIDGRITDGG
jgi:hypothetical protein